MNSTAGVIVIVSVKRDREIRTSTTMNHEHEFRRPLSSFVWAEHMTGNSVAARPELQRRFGLVTNGFAMRATGMKTTSRRRMHRAGNIALKDHPLLFLAVGHGNGREQGPRVGVFGILVNGLALRHLHDFAQIHDGHPMADMLDDS